MPLHNIIMSIPFTWRMEGVGVAAAKDEAGQLRWFVAISRAGNSAARLALAGRRRSGERGKVLPPCVRAYDVHGCEWVLATGEASPTAFLIFSSHLLICMHCIMPSNVLLLRAVPCCGGRMWGAAHLPQPPRAWLRHSNIRAILQGRARHHLCPLRSCATCSNDLRSIHWPSCVPWVHWGRQCRCARCGDDVFFFLGGGST